MCWVESVYLRRNVVSIRRNVVRLAVRRLGEWSNIHLRRNVVSIRRNVVRLAVRRLGEWSNIHLRIGFSVLGRIEHKSSSRSSQSTWSVQSSLCSTESPGKARKQSSVVVVAASSQLVLN